ncbi:uncharacterized protein LOC116217797 isoform X3 [Meleagris gallopavo]|uniref:uncharacterized protein LOC116217797 isoform X3 n=1 Tax=Meleagris gallopavo TaxID=9103 RepID=UPI0012AC4578|nr:uncharacterized protein LOC116217797 isoform X3 [Meleagris gallopavo]
MPGSACARGLCQAQGHFGMRGGSQENKCSPGFLQPHPAPGAQGKMKAVAVTVLLLLASMCLQAQAGLLDDLEEGTSGAYDIALKLLRGKRNSHPSPPLLPELPDPVALDLPIQG